MATKKQNGQEETHPWSLVLGVVIGLLIGAFVLRSCAIVDLQDRVGELEWEHRNLDIQNYQLEQRVNDLEGTVEAIQTPEKFSVTSPTLYVHCKEGMVNGPPEIPFSHPVIEIEGQVNYPGLWLVIQAFVDGQGPKNYIVSALHGPAEYTSIFDGYILSIRGDNGYHILTSEAEYVLLGYRGWYTTGMPVFRAEDLAFRVEFNLPDCSR